MDWAGTTLWALTLVLFVGCPGSEDTFEDQCHRLGCLRTTELVGCWIQQVEIDGDLSSAVKSKQTATSGCDPVPIVWVAGEDFLYARREALLQQCRSSDRAIEPRDHGCHNQLVGAWPVRHFDDPERVCPSYEQYNIIRGTRCFWWERRYLRVGWRENLANPELSPASAKGSLCGPEGPYACYPLPANPTQEDLAPRLERDTEGRLVSISAAHRLLLRPRRCEPGSTDDPDCAFEHWPILTVRQTYVRLPHDD